MLFSEIVTSLLSNFEIRILCHSLGVFGEAVASLTAGQRALLDRGRSSSGTKFRRLT